MNFSMARPKNTIASTGLGREALVRRKYPLGLPVAAEAMMQRPSRVSSQSGPSETERAKMYRNWMPQADGFQTLRADVSRRNIAIGYVACAQVAWKSS